MHLACDGGDKSFASDSIVYALLHERADIEAVDDKGNTPFLRAAGTGITDVVWVLVNARANIQATNLRGQGALEKAQQSSRSLAAGLKKLGVKSTVATESGRTRHGVSQQRAARRVLATHDEDSRWSYQAASDARDRSTERRRW